MASGYTRTWACARVQSKMQYTQRIHADPFTEAETGGTRGKSTLEPRSARKPRAELSRLKSAIHRASAYVAPASMREDESVFFHRSFMGLMRARCGTIDILMLSICSTH